MSHMVLNTVVYLHINIVLRGAREATPEASTVNVLITILILTIFFVSGTFGQLKLMLQSSSRFSEVTYKKSERCFF